MKAVCFGGSGFIGSYVVMELAKDRDVEVVIADVVPPDYDWPIPRNVRWKDCDIRYMDEVLEVTRGADEVYNIAGVLGTSELNLMSSRAADTNTRGTVNVLEACRVNSVGRVYYPTKPNDWLNTYSITKFAGEQFGLMYQQEFGMHVSVLKWMNAIGPRQHPYPVRKMIPTFCLQARFGQDVTLYGDGTQTVDLIDVRDIAKIAVYACRNLGRLSKVLDVGRGEALTVKSVAEAIVRLQDSDSRIVCRPMRAGEPEHSEIKADVALLKEFIDFGFRPYTKTLDDTIAYYRKLPAGIVRNAFRYWGEEFVENATTAAVTVPAEKLG